MANELILIVEDNPKNLKLVRDALQVKGYQTIEAGTGEEGVQLARTKTRARLDGHPAVRDQRHGEFRRRVKTQGSLPSEDTALILLFSLVASGQIKLRRIDGWQKIATVLSQQTVVAA